MRSEKFWALKSLVKLFSSKIVISQSSRLVASRYPRLRLVGNEGSTGRGHAPSFFDASERVRIDYVGPTDDCLDRVTLVMGH